MSQIVDKAQKLLEIMNQSGDPQSIIEVKSLYERAKHVSLMESLKDHDAIKFIVEHFSKQIRDINRALADVDSTELPDKARDRMIDRKRDLQAFLTLFDFTGAESKSIEDALDYELEPYNE